jgi:hypothetical protein
VKNYYGRIAIAFLCAVLSTAVFSQKVVTVLPSAPNSSDTIFVTMQFSPVPLFNGDSYRFEMEANRIPLILSAVDGIAITGLPFPLYYEVGKLPAGTYAVDAFMTEKGTGNLLPLGSSSSFTVTNGRIGKTSPFVTLNVSDHWWSPAESGWGLFVWHDRLDHLLAAWFTYGADNKPVWYTIQGGAWVTPSAYEGKIFQTTGPHFSTFVPGSPVQALAVGTARLEFVVDTGTFTYTLSGVTQTKSIVRFKP